MQPIIDIHIHTEFHGGKDLHSGVDTDIKNYLKYCKMSGIVGGVTDSYFPHPEFDFPKYNIKKCAVIGLDRHINPDFLLSQIESSAISAIKINSAFIQRYPTDKIYNNLYTIAAKHSIPVLFHTGYTVIRNSKMKYSDPLAIDDVAVDNPNLNIILVHAGCPWFQSAVATTVKNPNVYIEASDLFNCGIKDNSEIHLKKYILDPISYIFDFIGDPSKILFGSGWPGVDMVSYVECYKAAIPEEHWPQVFYENAKKLFKFSDI